MADNTTTSSGVIASDEVTYSGDTADVQLMRPVLVTGAEGSKTVVALTGDATNGLDVDVTQIVPVDQGAAGSIADPWPVVITDGTNVVVPDGSGRIPVTVASLPALPAGTNNIGDVDVLTLPALPTGANTIGKVDQGTGGASAWKVDGSAVTQPVSGTFWQATQPVSGTFWQATQPVSLASLPALAAGTALVGKVGIDQTTPGTTNKVSIGTDGTVAINAAIPAGTNAIGKLAANAGVNIGDVAVTSIAAGTNRIGAFRQVDSADADQTAVKGTQTSRFLGTQSAKDSGRTHVNYYAVAAAAGTTGTETAISLTKASGTSATSAANSHTPTSGKRFRITSISFATRGHATATIQTTTFSLRINTGGAVTTGSTPIVLQARSATPATASAWDRVIIPIPDGFEIVGDGTLQFGVTAAATYTTNAPTWDVTITGFEY